MGCRGRYYYTPRTVACLGTHARSTKDQARPASDGIPQGMILQPPLNDYILKAPQLLVPRRQRAQYYPHPQFAPNAPGWGGEGHPMHAYPPPGKTQD